MSDQAVEAAQLFTQKDLRNSYLVKRGGLVK